MRLTIIALALLASVGCGYSSKNYNPGMGGVGSPTVSAIMPNSVMSGSAGFTLTVNGSNFGTDATVYWNGVAHASTYVTGAQVTAAISSTDVANPGMIPVYVRTGGMNSNTVNFNVQ
jgi:hypothetical protein